jgi:hypothetical protein
MGKLSPVVARGHHPKLSAKAPKVAKWAKAMPQGVAITTNCNDDDGREVDGSNEEHVTAAKHDLKHQA